MTSLERSGIDIEMETCYKKTATIDIDIGRHTETEQTEGRLETGMPDADSLLDKGAAGQGLDSSVLPVLIQSTVRREHG